MFGRKRGAGAVTVVASGTSFDGELHSDGAVHVDGRVQGSVEAGGALSIGPGGIVLGDLSADEITVGGRVEGTVVARTRLHMLATGHVQGDARYGSLEVEHGGLIQGRAMPIAGFSTPAALPSPPPPADDDIVEVTPLPTATPAPTPTPTPAPSLAPTGRPRLPSRPGSPGTTAPRLDTAGDTGRVLPEPAGHREPAT